MSNTSLAAEHRHDDKTAEKTALAVLIAISFSHMLNDTMQSLLLSIYPMLKENYDLDFGQIGLITLTFQVTASLLQPMIGLYTDHKPRPYALAIGMASTFLGTGSSVFHPEASRVARLASGGRHGLAQSLFQVGGNLGSAIGPLAAAYIVLPRGQDSIAWFSFAALAAILVLMRVGAWYSAHLADRARKAPRAMKPGLRKPGLT